MKKIRVLIVEDDDEVARRMAENLVNDRESYEYHPQIATTAKEALRLYEQELGLFDVVLLDLMLDNSAGTLKSIGQSSWKTEIEGAVQLAEDLRNRFFHVVPPRLIVCSQYAKEIEGAFEVKQRIKFHNTVDKGGRKEDVVRFLRTVKHQCDLLEKAVNEAKSSHIIYDLIPRLPFLTICDRLCSEIRDVQSHLIPESGVLLLGRTGAGKGQLARVLHANGPRFDGRLYDLALPELPESLIEPQLFGAERGSFTGCDRKIPSRILEADGGTLFLDELGWVKGELQRKLLRVIEKRQVLGVSEIEYKSFDVLLIAAHQISAAASPMTEEIARRFTHVIRLPDLRERPEDIEFMASYCAKAFGSTIGVPNLRFAPGALQEWKEENWVGNVSDLMRRIALTLRTAERKNVDLIEEEHLFRQNFDYSSVSVPVEISPSDNGDNVPQKKSFDDSFKYEMPAHDFMACLNDDKFLSCLKPEFREMGLIQRSQVYLTIHMARRNFKRKDMEKLLGVNENTFREWMKKFVRDDVTKQLFPRLIKHSAGENP